MTRLAIDFGTSHTVAVLQTPNSAPQPLLFGDSPLLPSAVFASEDGKLLVGRDATRAARSDPARFEPHPKQRIDDGTVLLGEHEFSVEALIAAVFGTVTTEAKRVAGGPPSQVVVTHPADWSKRRRGQLLDAAREAGLGEAVPVPEPTAAALFYSQSLPPRPGGDVVVVYDFGGGTFDVCVLSRGPQGVSVIAEAGLNDAGGSDLDIALFDHIGQFVPAEVWQRLVRPADGEARRSRLLLLEDVRSAKEQLARSSHTTVHVPLADKDVAITREEFETIAAPLLERTVALTADTVRRTASGSLAGVFLVGGSSRVPLVSTLLHRQLVVAPSAVGQPEQVVASGALLAAPVPAPVSPATGPMTPPPASHPTNPLTPPPPTAPPAPLQPPREPVNKKLLFSVVGGGLALMLTLGIGWFTIRSANPQWAFSSQSLAQFAEPWMEAVGSCRSGGTGERYNGPGFEIGTEVEDTAECSIGDDSIYALVFIQFQSHEHRDAYRGFVASDETERPHDNAVVGPFDGEEDELYWEGEGDPVAAYLTGTSVDAMVELWHEYGSRNSQPLAD